jgi:peptide/nickel transport system ATP-binding protein
MQRVALARAFAARPTLLLCDEVTSALDVSVQATILNLIRDLASESGTAVVFVSHDLAVVRSVAARAVVMQGGHVREQGLTEDLFANPTNEYTQELLRAIPTLGEFRRDTGAPRALAPQP